MIGGETVTKQGASDGGGADCGREDKALTG